MRHHQVGLARLHNDMSARDDALLHPVRIRIVQILASSGPCTARQLDDALADVPMTSLYRHLGRLVEAQLLDVIGERPVRGSIEKTYALAAATDSPQAGPDATAEEYFRSFLATIAMQLSTISRYLDQGAKDPQRDGVAWQVSPAWLSDDELAALQETVQAALSHPPSAERRLRLVALSTLPALDETEP